MSAVVERETLLAHFETIKLSVGTDFHLNEEQVNILLQVVNGKIMAHSM